MTGYGVLLQIDEALNLSSREWTIAGLALFFLFASWIGFILVFRRTVNLWREDVRGLVADRTQCEQGRSKDLQDQVTKRGEDVKRLEQALAEYARVQREARTAATVVAERIGALEQRCETIDRRTETILQAVDRRAHPRSD